MSLPVTSRLCRTEADNGLPLPFVLGGEASTSYLARQQLLNNPSMASLQASSSNSLEHPSAEGPTRGRSSYSVSNSLRTKPGRPDAPLALSLSCSDKIAQYRLVGIQGSLLSELVGVVRLEGVVLGPQAGEDSEAWKSEAETALDGRGRSALENGEVQGMSPVLRRQNHVQSTDHDSHLTSLSAASWGVQLFAPAPDLPLGPVFPVLAPGSPFGTRSVSVTLLSVSLPSPSSSGPSADVFLMRVLVAGTLSIASHPKPEKLAAGGFKLGSAKRKGSDVLHPSSRSAVCKLSMVGRWRDVWEKMGREA